MMDTERPKSRRLFETLGFVVVPADVPDRSVTTFAVVEHFDVEVNTPLRFLTRPIAKATSEFRWPDWVGKGGMDATHRSERNSLVAYTPRR